MAEATREMYVYVSTKSITQSLETDNISKHVYIQITG